MSKTTAPLLSFAASGQVAKSQVYSTWRGVPYVRRYVVPKNPNSVGQQSTRNTFKFLSDVWKNAPSLLQDPWTAYSSGQSFYNRNAFIGKNTKLLRAGTDTTAFLASPGAGGGIQPISIAVTPGAGVLTVAFTNPTPPTSWSITDAIACAILNGDPHTATTFTVVAADDSVTFDSVALNGLTSAVLYTVCAWLKWTKADGTTAYSSSISTTATPT